jgi:hypothetical protein
MRKSEILVINGKRDKYMHAKTYAGRIKATRGLHNLADPRNKPMSHRIVRSQMKREFQKEINECDE